MLSTARPVGREFTERGVQTDFSDNEPSSPAPPTVPTEESLQTALVEPFIDASPLAAAHSRTSTQFDSAYSHDHTEISFDSVSSEANRSMTTTTRAYKRVQLPTNRPSTLLERHSSSRVFSLPEATPKFRMKNVLGKKTPRVVSMPSAAARDAHDLDISTHAGDPFGSDDEEHTRVRVKSQATDVPYTPSAPSSPDSVEIITNHNNQLSNDFLRPRRDDELSSPESDEDDWLTWAESPPRPIPALHGPLSLPYARCPSGAEGTIIEEPESLPRVIWGLAAEEAKVSRPHQHVPSSRHVPRKVAVPMDTSERDRRKLSTDLKQHATHASQVSIVLPQRRPPQAPQNVVPRQAPQQPPQPPDFVLKHSEPIDLGRLGANASEGAHRAPPSDHATYPPRWQPSYQHQLPTPELVHDLSPELQAMLFAQERLRTQAVSPSYLGTPSDMNGPMKHLPAGSSLSVLDSLQSSRSPILLDDLATPYGLYSRGLSAQMSALGLGQKHRQQQQQHHAFLPTPPSSTSPLWASGFSPYQGSVLSPELLAAAAAAGLSPLNPNFLATHAMLPRVDNSHYGLGSNTGTLNNQYVTVPVRMKISDGLAPPAQINNATAQKLPPRLAAEYARRRAGAEASVDRKQMDDDSSHLFSSPVRGASQSPRVPKPPPNTPYGAAKRTDSRGQSASLAVPSSPSSPHSTQSPGLTQHTRSIPLAKLMQRRLSIVQEEDHASSVENGRTTAAHAHGHARGAGSASGLHLYLSPSGRTNINAASLGLSGDALGTHYGAGDAQAIAEKTRNTGTGVKVPSRMFGPSGRGEAQAVKEGHRRQGSDTANKDGGQRGDGGRGRAQKRGGRGRRGRGLHAGSMSHGAERVDGGMMVKS
ncbi:hypothetical protein C2E23DRAFT_880163 [Lenzites betulinus]|nr:hypothetical protein C2E23DRAFT_880163 [Lenzites betulinus]